MGKFKAILQEPLVHFFLIGGVFFLLYYAVNTGSRYSTADENTITVSKGQIDTLRQNFTRVWSRQPTEKELQGLIQDYIQEEILYREAVALGLNKDDTVIRRRLRQKMEFLAENILSQSKPTDEELQSYFQKHKDRYQKDPQFSFAHVYLNPEKHGEKLDKEVVRLLSILENNEESTDVSELGDNILIESQFHQSPYGVVSGLFGNTFAEELLMLPSGEWAGPLTSGYGVHLVYLREKVPGKMPEFEQIKDVLEAHWNMDRNKEIKNEAFTKMKNQYHIVVED